MAASTRAQLLLAMAALDGVAVHRALWAFLAPADLPAVKPVAATARRGASSATSSSFGKGSRRARRAADESSTPHRRSQARRGRSPWGATRSASDPFRRYAAACAAADQAQLEEMRRQEGLRRAAAERAALKALIQTAASDRRVYLSGFRTPEKRRIAVFADESSGNLQCAGRQSRRTKFIVGESDTVGRHQFVPVFPTAR